MDTSNGAAGDYDVVFADMADAPTLLSDKDLVGKTISAVLYATVPGAFGADDALLLRFTDGTAHTFVFPRFEE